MPNDDILRQTTIFRHLSAHDRAHVATIVQVRSYERGERILTEGNRSDVFLTIVTRRVKVSKVTPGGKEIILEIVGAGDPLGTVASLDGSPFPASAVALEPTTCVMVATDDFFVLLEQHTSIVRGVLLGLTQRLVELTRRISELTGGRVESRTARLLLKLADQVGRSERAGIVIPMALTRQEIADLTGTTVETCIRIMSRWSKEEVLRTERDGFVVLAPEVLEAAAGA